MLSVYVAKTEALISAFVVVFYICKSSCFHDAAQMSILIRKPANAVIYEDKETDQSTH